MMVADTRVDKYPVTSQTMDDKLQHQSPGTGQDGDRTKLIKLNSRSTSDHMASPYAGLCPRALVTDIDRCLTIWQPPYFGHHPVTTLVMI
ncbi:hypothetical protein DPMN_055487 [Dreissena polymorpha]|uniref:Uncharacterized protein n=1 Tax=Dreissena polymorpha TaxID=45954 RepID=A0A9D4CSP3_DREPO|nr:hypothetical protein DPMN_055487 [Dreissena polymorpha]